MYDPYGNPQDWRAQRRYARDMRRYNRYQNPMRGLAGGIILIALIIGFTFNNALSGSGFLVVFFIGLALASLFGSFSTMHRYSIYGGMYGFIWLLGLALCFIIGFWPWILLPVAVTMILSALYRPIMGGLAGAGFMAQQPIPQQPYQPQEQPGYQQPYQPPYQEGYQQPYQEGYQGAPPQPHNTYQEGPAQPHNTYQEGGTPYEPPQVQHPEQPQELPPMEQQ